MIQLIKRFWDVYSVWVHDAEHHLWRMPMVCICVTLLYFSVFFGLIFSFGHAPKNPCPQIELNNTLSVGDTIKYQSRCHRRSCCKGGCR